MLQLAIASCKSSDLVPYDRNEYNSKATSDSDGHDDDHISVLSLSFGRVKYDIMWKWWGVLKYGRPYARGIGPYTTARRVRISDG